LKKTTRALCFVLLALCPCDSFEIDLCRPCMPPVFSCSLSCLNLHQFQTCWLSEHAGPKLVLCWCSRLEDLQSSQVRGTRYAATPKHSRSCNFFDGPHYSLSICWFEESILLCPYHFHVFSSVLKLTASSPCFWCLDCL
jgi:hypothetical protein